MGEIAGRSPLAATDSDGWEGADKRGKAALIASATWSLTMPRTSSSRIPGVAADEETGGGPRGPAADAEDDPGDPERGSIEGN